MLNEPRSIAKIYLKFAFIFGLLLVFLIPPFQNPDEDSHFKKSYLVSNFNFFPESKDGVNGSYYPKTLLDFESNYRYMIGQINEKYSFSKFYLDVATEKNYHDKEFIQYSTLYTNPILYFPQAFSMIVFKVILKIFAFGGNSFLTPIAYMQAGRIGNLILYLFFTYNAIRIIPFFKNVLALLLLMPMSLSLASSLSYDAIVISFTVFFISLVLYYAYDKNAPNLTRREIILLCLMSILLIELKQVYFPVVLLLFIIPVYKYKNVKSKAIVNLIVIFAGIVSHLVYLLCTKLLLKGGSTGSGFAADQEKFILNHPFEYIKILFATFKELKFFYVNSFIGNLGWLDTNFPVIFICIYLIYIIITAVFDGNNENVLTWKTKLIALSIFLSSAILIETALYVTWTSIPEIGGIGYRIVSGVQGRYFIPVALLGLLWCALPKKTRLLENAQQRVIATIPLFLVFSGIFTLLIVLLRYWVSE